VVARGRFHFAAGTAVVFAVGSGVCAEPTRVDTPESAESVQILGATLHLERAADAVECADAATIAERVEPIANRSAGAPPLEIRVFVRREGPDPVAEITVRGAKQGTRALRGTGPSCDDLEKSLVAALALMLDDTADSPVAPKRPSAKPEPRQNAKPGQPSWLSAGGGVAIDLASEPLLLGWLGFDRGTERFGFGLGVFATPNASEEFGPGHVDVRWLGGILHGCAALAGARSRFHLSACIAAALAALRGEAVGYQSVGTEYRPWYAVGLESMTAGPLGGTGLGWSLSLSVLVPLHAESFSVSGLGTAFETPPVGFWGRLGVTFRLE
jgi:hypothetical protein